MAWAVQIASKSSAAVNALPSLAPVPPLFAGITLEQRSLIHLLSSNCPLGKMLRQLSLYFAEQNIQGALCLQGGTIVDQIQQEIDECDYDLVVMAADTERSIIRRIMGKRVNPVLSLAEVPVSSRNRCNP